VSQIAATMGATVDEIGELRKAAREMGSETNYSATQAAGGLNILAMSGYNAEESMDMLGDVLHLAAAGSMEMSTAAADISGAMKGFDDATKDSAYYADLMAKGATLANTSVKQLGEALSTGSAMGKAYSQTAEDMTVSLLRLAEQGETGSNAATMLAAAYANIYTPMDQAKKAMQELGVEAYDPTTGKAREFNEVINELNEAITEHAKKNGEVDQELANQYTNIIFGRQGLEAYNKLVVTSIDKQKEWRESLVGASGAASEQYDTMTDNLQGDMDKMKSAFEDLQIEISDQVTPDLRNLVQVATEGLTWLTDHANTLIGVIEAVGVAFAAIKLPAMIGAVTTAMRTLNAVCAQFPLAAAFAAAVAVGEVLKGVIDDCTDAINEIPDAYEGLDENEVDFVKKIAEGTDDITEANARLEESQKRLRALQDERTATQNELNAAVDEYNRLAAEGGADDASFTRMFELANDVIPKLKNEIKEQNAAVGEMAQAKMDAQAQVNALTEAQEQEQKALEETTAAEIEQAETEEELSAKKELFAEKLKTSMKEALTVSVELNGKTAELSRTTAESMGEIIDQYDEMYAHQKQAIESSFDLFDGFTADTSLTFDTLMQNLKDTSFYMNDWALAIEQLGQKGVSKKLLDELKGMGADSWQIIYAMNHATEGQLKEYSDLWDRTDAQITTTTDRMMADEKSRVENELSGLAGMPGAKLEEIKAAFAQAGLEGVKGYADGISEHFNLAEKAVDDLVDDQIKKFGESKGKWENIGEMIPKGLAEGMKGKAGLEALNDAVSAIVKRVTDETEKQFKIESPSKVFAAMGEYLPGGLAVGMEDGTASAEKAAADMADDVIDAARSELTDADIDIGVNADIDRISRADSYRSAGGSEQDFYTRAGQPMTVKIVTPDGRTLAEWLFPDMNELLGRESVLQIKSYAR
jgi:TP901 family phage tail tape measure protein